MASLPQGGMREVRDTREMGEARTSRTPRATRTRNESPYYINQVVSLDRSLVLNSCIGVSDQNEP